MTTYAERWTQAVEQLKQLVIYVPVTDGLAGIAQGAGIVGERDPSAPGRVLVHYEGWVHGAAQYADLDARGRWEAGVEHAAGRALTQYPTVARASLPKRDLIAVGAYHCCNEPGNRALVWDESRLQAWIDGPREICPQERCRIAGPHSTYRKQGHLLLHESQQGDTWYTEKEDL